MEGGGTPQHWLEATRLAKLVPPISWVVQVRPHDFLVPFAASLQLRRPVPPRSANRRPDPFSFRHRSCVRVVGGKYFSLPAEEWKKKGPATRHLPYPPLAVDTLQLGWTCYLPLGGASLPCNVAGCRRALRAR